MLAGMDSLPDLLSHVDEEIQRDALWIFNKVISNSKFKRNWFKMQREYPVRRQQS
jgi:hypothetical protein